VNEVGHRRRRKFVDPVPQADVGGRDQVGPRGQVSTEQAGDRDADHGGAVQHGGAGDPARLAAGAQRLRDVAAVGREVGVVGQGEAQGARYGVDDKTYDSYLLRSLNIHPQDGLRPRS
jgi:hypothetical protein